MIGRPELERFLRTDPRDVGCEQAMAVLEIYVELILDDDVNGEGRGAAERRYPGAAAHLLACGPCAQDLQGLLLAARGSDRT